MLIDLRRSEIEMIIDSLEGDGQPCAEKMILVDELYRAIGSKSPAEQKVIQAKQNKKQFTDLIKESNPATTMEVNHLKGLWLDAN